MVASGVLFGALFGYWRYWPNRRHQRRVRDMTALRDLLAFHIDDLEDILHALNETTGGEF